MKNQLLLLTLIVTTTQTKRFKNFHTFKKTFKTLCSPIPKKKLKHLTWAQEDLQFEKTKNKKIFSDQPFIFLGKGGYSQVFLDRSKKNVVKIIKSKKMESLTSLFSLKKEVIFGFEYFFKTRKKGGVKKCGFDFGKKEDFGIVMILDYLKGDDMNYFNKMFLEECEIGLKRNLFLFKELGLLVFEFHEMGYVHRDIKPSNFFLENEKDFENLEENLEKKNTKPENKKSDQKIPKNKQKQKKKTCGKLNPYLIDLALSIKKKNSNIYYGTKSYMANEMLTEDWYNNTIDVYSLGVSFLEFLRLDIKNFKVDISLLMIIESMLMDNWCYYFKKFEINNSENLKMVFCDNSDFYWEYQFSSLEELFFYFFDLKKNYCEENLNLDDFLSFGNENLDSVHGFLGEAKLIKCFDVDNYFNFFLTCRPAMRDLKKIFDVYYNWKFNNSKSMYGLYEKVFEKNIMFDYRLFLDSGFIGVMYRHFMPNVFKLLNDRRYFLSDFGYW